MASTEADPACPTISKGRGVSSQAGTRARGYKLGDSISSNWRITRRELSNWLEHSMFFGGAPGSPALGTNDGLWIHNGSWVVSDGSSQATLVSCSKCSHLTSIASDLHMAELILRVPAAIQPRTTPS